MILRKLVLIRFNVSSGFGDIRTDRGVPAYADPVWLGSREALFNRYCWPSLRDQLDRDFTTLVFFDEATDRDFVARLLDGKDLVPLYTDRRNGVVLRTNEYLARTLRNAGPAAGTFVSTTRLDSDDAIAPDFLARIDEVVRAAPDHRPRVYYSFPLGQKYITRTKTYRKRYFKKNSFGTLVERWTPKGIATVFVRRHMEMVDHEPTVFIKDGRGHWCNVVHGGNVRNSERGVDLARPYFPVGDEPPPPPRKGLRALLRFR